MSFLHHSTKYGDIGMIAAASLGAILLAFVGCESDSDGSSAKVKVTPKSAQVAKGGSIPISASGGSGQYRWSLNLPSAGRLSAYSGATVVYTATKNGVTQQVNVLDPSTGAIVAQCYVAQGTTSSNTTTTTSSSTTSTTSSSTTTTTSSSTTSTNNTSSSGSNTNSLVKGNLSWASTPPSSISINSSAQLSVKGYNDVNNLKWSIGEYTVTSTNSEEKVIKCIEFIGTHDGRDAVTIRGMRTGRATIVVEETKTYGGNSSLRQDITVN